MVTVFGSLERPTCINSPTRAAETRRSPHHPLRTPKVNLLLQHQRQRDLTACSSFQLQPSSSTTPQQPHPPIMASIPSAVGPAATASPVANPVSPTAPGASLVNPGAPGANPGEASAAQEHIVVDDELVCSPEYYFSSDAKSPRPHLLTTRFLRHGVCRALTAFTIAGMQLIRNTLSQVLHVDLTTL